MAGSFLDYGPLLKGAFLGLSKCLIWAGLGTPWDVEVACYEGGVLQKIQVDPPGRVSQGVYHPPSGGSIGWLVSETGQYQIGIVAADGSSSFNRGKF